MEFEWKGETYTLVPLTVDDIIEFEQIAKITMHELGGRMTLAHLRTLVWIGLKKTISGITEAEIGAMPFTDGRFRKLQDFLLAGRQTESGG